MISAHKLESGQIKEFFDYQKIDFISKFASIVYVKIPNEAVCPTNNITIL